MSRLNQLLAFHAASPKDSFVLFALAKEYEKMGDFGQALQHYREITSADPNYVGVYYHLGKLEEKMEGPQQAMVTYRTGMDVAQKAGDRHAYSELAGAKLELGDDDED